MLGDDEFHILDDDMKRRLVERVKQFADQQSEIFLNVDFLQTVSEALVILESKPKFLRVSILSIFLISVLYVC